MEVRIRNDKVLIKQAEAVKVSEGGIMLPEGAVEKENYGEIVALGTAESLSDLEVGQKVMYNKYSGTPVKIDGKEYTLVPQEAVSLEYK